MQKSLIFWRTAHGVCLLLWVCRYPFGNSQIGVVRARVPELGTTQQALDFYNLIHETSLTEINQKYE